VICKVNHVVTRTLAATLLLTLELGRVSLAQTPEEIVQWSASVDAPGTVKHGGTATLNVSGEVSDGWHVYALAQLPGGPTALQITLDDNLIARVAGAPTGTVPEKKHDPSFDLDTRFYRHSFALHVPITVKPRAETGAQVIPLDIRFQSCSERECLPPKTIRLSVSVIVLSDT
jgi:Disulphide bond corrector protein DsbC